MLCSNCGKAEAVTHVKTNFNGKKNEIHLCPECAAKLGYISSVPTSFDALFGSMFGFNLGITHTKEESCPFCGSTLSEFVKKGKAGCGQCYEAFYESIIDSVKRIHGAAEHRGKIPGKAGKRVRLENEISTLREEMQEAIGNEDFERAAEIRDEIKRLSDGQ